MDVNDQTPDAQINEGRAMAVRSPRSAAIAGIVFALLSAISMVLVTTVANAAVPQEAIERFTAQSRTISIALGLVPFAGIAFLWFTGVIRDHLGEREDQFFATVFLGSGLIFLAMLFVWSASLGAMYGIVTGSPLPISDDIFIYGFYFTQQVVSIYALRMAGVYMLSIGTIWMRTAIVPRWLTIITYIVALGFIFFAGPFRELRLVFPGWVLLVSVYILIANRRAGLG